ncbi:MAG TPA: GNAT family N-acetyltransferase [Patescibacteria group bacterium]|nr:GNAT family N-acetyltransferase [Patescibacteria group bacterium]
MKNEKINLLRVSIESEHLLLVPPALKYAAEIYKEFNNEAVIRFMNAMPRTITDAENFVRTSLVDMKAGKKLVCSILKKSNKEFLGNLSILDVDTATPEVAIWLKKSAHGSGYGLEAVKALKEWLDGHIDYEYLQYPVANVNMASRKIPEALGGVIAQKDFAFTKVDGSVWQYTNYKIYKGTLIAKKS